MAERNEVLVTYDGTKASEFSELLSFRLPQYGLHVLLDDSSLQPPSGLISGLQQAIERAAAVVVVLSDTQGEERRTWVPHELTLTLRRHRAVIPVVLSDGDLSGPLESLVADRRAFVATQISGDQAAQELAQRIGLEAGLPSEPPLLDYARDRASARAMQKEAAGPPRGLRFGLFAGAMLAILGIAVAALWFWPRMEAPVPPPDRVWGPGSCGRGEIPSAVQGRAPTDLAACMTAKGGAPGLDLARLDCPYCILKGLDFRGTILNGANLRGADLSRSAFIGAQLRGSDLRGANLSGADLSFADLRGARLDDADLAHTAFHNAVLTGASYSPRTILTDDIRPYLSSMSCALCESP